LDETGFSLVPFGIYDRFDGIGCHFRAFVFPYTNHGPANLFQLDIGIGISSPVGFDLLQPKLRIALGPARVFRTTMPETTIDEHRNFELGKSQISDPTRPFQHLVIDSISQSQPMQSFSQSHFGFCARLADLRHPNAGFW